MVKTRLCLAIYNLVEMKIFINVCHNYHLTNQLLAELEKKQIFVNINILQNTISVFVASHFHLVIRSLKYGGFYSILHILTLHLIELKKMVI